MHRNSFLVAIGVCSALAAPLAAATTPASAAGAAFTIVTSPPLSPSFSANTPNYAVACSGHATTHVTTTGSGASVIGGKQQHGNADVQAHLVPGQALEITGGGHPYSVRCLPADFPKYTATIAGTPQTKGFLITPADVAQRAPRPLCRRVRRARRARVVVPGSQRAARREVLRAVDHRLGQRDCRGHRGNVRAPRPQRSTEAHRWQSDADPRRARRAAPCERSLPRDSRRCPQRSRTCRVGAGRRSRR